MKAKKPLIFSLITALMVTSVATPAFAQELVVDQGCNFEEPEERVYNMKFITVRRKLRVDKGEKLKVDAYFQNTGNVPFFSEDSKCAGIKTYLGTDLDRDRESNLYEEGLDGWAASNRIKMSQERVNPGEVATFTFTANAGDKDTILKEYFAPVVSGVTWIDDARFGFDVIVGEPEGTPEEIRQKMQYARKSGDILEMIDLKGEKKMVIDLSDQKMKVYIGETEIKELPVSTGAYGTPTPVGTHKIVGKQEVRIGGKRPHYIMPNFQMLSINGRPFTGYGIHALPSLGNSHLRAKIRNLQRQGLPIPTSLYEDDVMWTEAWDHLGTPVSHGCVRTAPDDAKFLFEFTDVGETVVVVQR